MRERVVTASVALLALSPPSQGHQVRSLDEPDRHDGVEGTVAPPTADLPSKSQPHLRHSENLSHHELLSRNFSDSSIDRTFQSGSAASQGSALRASALERIHKKRAGVSPRLTASTSENIIGSRTNVDRFKKRDRFSETNRSNSERLRMKSDDLDHGHGAESDCSESSLDSEVEPEEMFERGSLSVGRDLHGVGDFSSSLLIEATPKLQRLGRLSSLVPLGGHRNRRPRIVCVQGAAGIGKSHTCVRIVEAWAKDARAKGYFGGDENLPGEDGLPSSPLPSDDMPASSVPVVSRALKQRFSVVTVDCLEVRGDVCPAICQVIGEWLFHVLQQRQEGEADSITQIIKDFVTTTDDLEEIEPVLPLLDTYVSTRFGIQDSNLDSASLRSDLVPKLLGWLLEKLADDPIAQSVLLYLENIHLMDTGSWEVFESFCRNSRAKFSTRVLVTCRTSDDPDRDIQAVLEPCASFTLTPVSRRKTLEIAAGAIGLRTVDQLDFALARQLIRRTFGVPLNIVTMAQASEELDDTSSVISSGSISDNSHVERFSVRSMVRRRVASLPERERLILRVVACIATISGSAPLSLTRKVYDSLVSKGAADGAEGKNMDSVLSVLTENRILKWTRVDGDREDRGVSFSHDVYMKAVEQAYEQAEIHDVIAFHQVGSVEKEVLDPRLAADLARHLEASSRSTNQLSVAARVSAVVAQKALDEGLWSRCIEFGRLAIGFASEHETRPDALSANPTLYLAGAKVTLPTRLSQRHIMGVLFSAHRLCMNALQMGRSREEAFLHGRHAFALLNLNVPEGPATRSVSDDLISKASSVVRHGLLDKIGEILDDQLVFDGIDVAFRFVILHRNEIWASFAAVVLLTFLGTPWKTKSGPPPILVQYRWGIGIIAGVRALMRAFPHAPLQCRVSFPLAVLKRSHQYMYAGQKLPFDEALITSAEQGGRRILRTNEASSKLARALLSERLHIAFDPVSAWCSGMLLLGQAQEVISAFGELDAVFPPTEQKLFMTGNNIETRCRVEGFGFVRLGDAIGARRCVDALSETESTLAPDRKFCYLSLLGCVQYLERGLSVEFVATIRSMLPGLTRSGSLAFIPALWTPLWHACELIVIAFCSEVFAAERDSLLDVIRIIVDVLFNEAGAFPWLAGAVWFWHGRYLELSGKPELGLRAITRSFRLLKRESESIDPSGTWLGELYAAQVAFHLSRLSRAAENSIEERTWLHMATSIWERHSSTRFFLQQPTDGAAVFEYSIAPASWVNFGRDGTGPGMDGSRGVRWLEGVELHEKIGAGSFGDCFLATWDGVRVAAKTVSRPGNDDDSHFSAARELEAEAKMLSALRHPNIVTVYGAAQFASKFFFVMELVDGGSALDVLRGEAAAKRPLSAESIMSIIQSLCAGMQYLHSERYIHGDISLRNLLISYTPSKRGKPQIHVKVSDLGLGQKVPRGADSVSVRGRIAARWAAPELLSSRGRSRSFASDVWAAGVTQWEAWSHGVAPFPNLGSLDAVVEEIVSGNVRRHITKPASCPSDFFQRCLVPCLVYEGEQRLSSLELLQAVSSELKAELKVQACWGDFEPSESSGGEALLKVETEDSEDSDSGSLGSAEGAGYLFADAAGGVHSADEGNYL